MKLPPFRASITTDDAPHQLRIAPVWLVLRTCARRYAERFFKDLTTRFGCHWGYLASLWFEERASETRLLYYKATRTSHRISRRRFAPPSDFDTTRPSNPRCSSGRIDDLAALVNICGDSDVRHTEHRAIRFDGSKDCIRKMLFEHGSRAEITVIRHFDQHVRSVANILPDSIHRNAIRKQIMMPAFRITDREKIVFFCRKKNSRRMRDDRLKRTRDGFAETVEDRSCRTERSLYRRCRRARRS
jgi:hypothetical protein